MRKEFTVKNRDDEYRDGSVNKRETSSMHSRFAENHGGVGGGRREEQWLRKRTPRLRQHCLSKCAAMVE